MQLLELIKQLSDLTDLHKCKKQAILWWITYTEILF